MTPLPMQLTSILVLVPQRPVLIGTERCLPTEIASPALPRTQAFRADPYGLRLSGMCIRELATCVPNLHAKWLRSVWPFAGAFRDLAGRTVALWTAVFFHIHPRLNLASQATGEWTAHNGIDISKQKPRRRYLYSKEGVSARRYAYVANPYGDDGASSSWRRRENVMAATRSLLAAGDGLPS
ncbi:hypothetical protein K523DRAFT_326704 [Schizophyllum commune Tattone D]|nr:hypothetical protein K523DRAFT_326704 [Schizophyllum commune Tattone D]